MQQSPSLPVLPVHGRGAPANPPNRFEPLEFVADWDVLDPEAPGPKTVYLRDHSKSIIAKNDSPDVGFSASVNPYRGCEHGCVYCYARPTHEYLGFSSGIDFESKILVKEDAPTLLRAALLSRSWTPQPIGLSGVTDAYQPVERKLRITRACLEVLAEFRNPVAIVTKNHLVTRDIDLLSDLAKDGAAVVNVSITTLDDALHHVMEPRTSTPKRRLEAVAKVAAAGIPVNVMVAPVIPGLTDHEIPRIVAAAAEAGARGAAMIPVRLPYQNKDLFERWLEAHFPDRKEKVLNRIRAIRGGKLNDSDFVTRMKGEGIFAEQMRALFHAACRKHGLNREWTPLSTAAFRRPHDKHGQLGLFETA